MDALEQLTIGDSGRRKEDIIRRYEIIPVSYTHLRAHETVLDLVCRLLLEKKKYQQQTEVDQSISL